MITYSQQFISKKDIKNVVNALKNPILTGGQKADLFEKKISNITNSKYSIVMSNATAALHAACYALGVKNGDYVWTTVNSFVSSANCGSYLGAKIDFIDTDPDTFNISIDELAIKLKRTPKNKIPKVIVIVHIGGSPCDLKKIRNITKKYSIKIIEDASHALGARYDKNIIGDCKYSDICVFSFHPVKIITTIEGGCCTTNNSKLKKILKEFRSVGVSRKSRINYEVNSIGYNYRLSDVQCVLGISQLNRLKNIIKKRRTIAKRYDKIFEKNPMCKLQKILPQCKSSYHLYIIQFKYLKKNYKNKIINFFEKKNILINTHYKPITKFKIYKSKNKFINAENYYNRSISLPVYESLSITKQNHIIKLINNILKKKEWFLR